MIYMNDQPTSKGNEMLKHEIPLTESERLQAYKDAVRDMVLARQRLSVALYKDEGVDKAAMQESRCVLRLIDLGDF
jgi:hypothetical protein